MSDEITAGSTTTTTTLSQYVVSRTSKPMIPGDITINDPIYTVLAAVLTIAYPILVMWKLRCGRRSTHVKKWKNFLKGAQLGIVCAFLIQDFFCSLAMAFPQEESKITTHGDQPGAPLEIQTSIMAYNPGWSAVMLPAMMLITIPFIQSGLWLGVVSASMVQQCVRLLLVMMVTPPVQAENGDSLLGVGDYFRTELLLAAVFVPVVLVLLYKMKGIQALEAEIEEDGDEEDLEIQMPEEETPSKQPLLENNNNNNKGVSLY